MKVSGDFICFHMTYFNRRLCSTLHLESSVHVFVFVFIDVAETDRMFQVCLCFSSVDI